MWNATLNKKILLSVGLLLVCAGAYWYWTRPKFPGFQGGMPDRVKPEVIADAEIMIKGQDALHGQAIVKSGETVEVVKKVSFTDEYSGWKIILCDFDFRPSVDGRVDWDTMRDVEFGFLSGEEIKSEWKVQLAPGEYEFRTHLQCDNPADITQPREIWMVAQGKLLVQPE